MVRSRGLKSASSQRSHPQHNQLWQQLRLAHAVNHEPTAAENVSIDVRKQLAELENVDQRHVDMLVDAIHCRNDDYSGMRVR
ncbi:MAG: hypothetical protein Q7V88_15275 [Actinomycetota bacterium]|nr:hypothetical protein [Actinomycetota bacterium]